MRIPLFLSSEVMIWHTYMYLTETKAENKSVAVVVLDKVAVTDTLNDKRRFVSVCQNGIIRIVLKGSPYILGTSVGYHVTVFRAALCRHKIVVIADFYYASVSVFSLIIPKTVG